jgi:hypothetical protein
VKALNCFNIPGLDSTNVVAFALSFIKHTAKNVWKYEYRYPDVESFIAFRLALTSSVSSSCAANERTLLELNILIAFGASCKAYTRGDGSVGQDITYLMPHLRIPKKSKFKKVRGEIIMKKSVFESSWSKDFENARNMASGLVNRKDIHNGVRDTDVVVYEVIEPRGVPSQQLKDLHAEGFNVVPHKVFKVLTEQDLIEYYAERRKKSKYEIDGLEYPI